MIEKDSHIKINPNHFYFGFGATSCLCNIAISVFNKGDLLSLDLPFYFAFRHDFHQSGV